MAARALLVCACDRTGRLPGRAAFPVVGLANIRCCSDRAVRAAVDGEIHTGSLGVPNSQQLRQLGRIAPKIAANLEDIGTTGRVRSRKGESEQGGVPRWLAAG